MEKLLQWSIANSKGEEEAMKTLGQPDPKALADLFGMGGPDEPTLMKQAMIILDNPEATVENKLIALENFEMLIENLDNANNIQNLNLWPTLIKNIDNENFSELICSIIGTANQNNDTSQQHFNKIENGFQKLIKLASESNDNNSSRMKALYALSNAIRHNPDGYHLFKNLGGWKIVKEIKDNQSDYANDNVRRRLKSLLTSILSIKSVNDEVKKEELPKIFSEDEIKEISDYYKH